MGINIFLLVRATAFTSVRNTNQDRKKISSEVDLTIRVKTILNYPPELLGAVSGVCLTKIFEFVVQLSQDSQGLQHSLHGWDSSVLVLGWHRVQVQL